VDCPKEGSSNPRTETWYIVASAVGFDLIRTVPVPPIFPIIDTVTSNRLISVAAKTLEMKLAEETA
jgi:hypothetical protein